MKASVCSPAPIEKMTTTDEERVKETVACCVEDVLLISHVINYKADVGRILVIVLLMVFGKFGRLVHYPLYDRLIPMIEEEVFLLLASLGSVVDEMTPRRVELYARRNNIDCIEDLTPVKMRRSKQSHEHIGLSSRGRPCANSSGRTGR